MTDHTVYDVAEGVAYRPAFDLKALHAVCIEFALIWFHPSAPFLTLLCSPTTTVEKATKIIHLMIVHLHAENDVKHVLNHFLEARHTRLNHDSEYFFVT